MPVSVLWSTASLRLALAFSIIFGLGAALLVAGVDYGLLRFAEEEVKSGLHHQLSIMRDGVGRVGANGLIDRLAAQKRNHEARRFLFLVVAPDGRTFSNGLKPVAVNPDGFRYNRGDKPRATRWPDQRPNMLVLSETTADGTLLAIGRDTQHLDELRGGIRSFALWSGLGIIALALLAGLFMGHLFLRRLNDVNRAVDRIISGNMSQRLPAIGFGREFDDLAHNLNHMLDRQEMTMGALKSVSEGIAHDLRTPLSRLRNRLDELEAVAENPEKRQAMIDLAIQEMEHISGLFEALLALSHVESGKGKNKAMIDAREIVRAVADAYGPVVEDAGGTMQVKEDVADGGEGRFMVPGDASLLMQALSNLVENALVHGGDRPSVGIEVRREPKPTGGHQLVFVVGDHGPGVPPEERENVVRRFYRMDRSRSRPGSGLGLAMCAAVAKWHGGELLLMDNEPGLRVEMRLPGA